MGNYVYCTNSGKRTQTYYLMCQGTKHLLFSQGARKSNNEVFSNGVPLSEIGRLRKHHSHTVRHTAEKLPKYIRFVEKECGIAVMEKTKRKLKVAN